jgi:CBS domain-containing protein
MGLLKTPLVLVEPDTRVAEVARKMKEQDVDVVLVLHEENRQPRGILTDRDIVVRCIAENIDVGDCTAEQILSESVTTIGEGESSDLAYQKMRESGVHHLVLVDRNGDAVGILASQ